MKKIVTVLSLFILLSSTLFAKGFFDQRFFEVKFDVPASVSNNAFGLSDILKEEVVIDLTKIANEMPSSGWTTIADADPAISLNLNLPLFNLGFEAGVEVYGKSSIGKGVFDFLGNGYDVGDKLNVSMDFDADVFISTGVKAGFNIGFFEVEVNPSVFVPVLHVAPEEAYIELENDENGDISMVAKTRVNAYSIVNLSGFDMSALSDIQQQVWSSMGFDLGGTVHFKYFDNLDLWGTARIPFVPGHLKYVASVGASAEYSGNVSDLLSSATTQTSDSTDTTTVSADEEGEVTSTDETETTGLVWEVDDVSNILFTEAETKYYINRPMKLNLYATYSFIPNFIEFTGGVGAGIRNPFAKDQSEVKFYPEYYLASQVGLANIIVVKASSEYTDQIFKHQLALKLNIRVVEMDVGASLQSSNFVNSLKFAGFGAFVNVYVGF